MNAGITAYKKEVTMKRILKIGADVHSSNYTLCAVEPLLEGDVNELFTVDVEPCYQEILRFIEKLKKRFRGDELSITCGYEAGCLGYKLFHDLEAHGVKCVILAPSTMEVPGGKRIKTDKRDAFLIAKYLAKGGFSAVHIPTQTDEAVRDYLRMRDDHKQSVKTYKQQINAFCLRHGYKYERTKWTQPHMKWLREIELGEIDRETLNSYLATYEQLTDAVERYDARIEELSYMDEYREKVQKLRCFVGIKTHTALSLIVETGDFSRFVKGSFYGSFVGLVPGEKSSGPHTNRCPITKAGNKHLRTLLTECAQAIGRSRSGYKSKELKSRQKGCPPEIVAYADKANDRLRRKFHKMIYRGKHKNVAATAVARELSCFVWGMMTDNIA